MRNRILPIAIAFVAAAPCAGFAGDKNKNKGIEVQDYGFGASMPVTTSRSDGGGSTVGRVTHKDISTTKYQDKASPLLMNKVGGGTGPTKPPLPTTSGRRQ
jgi:type VI protein secretion system component Hcp